MKERWITSIAHRFSVWRPYAFVGLTAVSGVLLSAALFSMMRNWEHARALAEFDQELETSVAVINTALSRHIGMLEFLQEFYAGSQSVERSEFDAFVDKAMARLGGFRLVAWIPRIPAAQRREFEDRLRAEGFSDVQVHPRTEETDCYPVDFIFPYAGNAQWHGLDLASDPACVKTLERARDSGSLTATPPFVPPGDSAEPPGVMLCLPIYRNGFPHQTADQKYAQLTGFVAGVLRVGVLTEHTLQRTGPPIMQMEIRDATEGESCGILYSDGPARADSVGPTPEHAGTRGPSASLLSDVSRQRVLEVGGRRWVLDCAPSPGCVCFRATALPYGASGAGVVITLLLTAYMASLTGASVRVDRLVKERSAELLESNQQLQIQMRERQRAEQLLQRNLNRQVRLSRLTQVDLPAVQGLEAKLAQVTEAIVEVFDADFCRIWVIFPGDRCAAGCPHAQVTEGPHVCRRRDRCLHLLASSGRYTHRDGGHARVPFGCYKIGRVAAGSEPKFVTNDVQHDTFVHNHDWATELGLMSFAGYRLCATDGTPIGVLALFAKHPLSPDEDHLLEGVAASASHVIQTTRAKQELERTQAELEIRVERRTAELAKANHELELEIAERKSAERQIRVYARQQAVLTSLLRIGIGEASLEDALGRCVEELVLNAGLPQVSFGGVYLTEDGADALVLTAYRSFAAPVPTMCTRIPLGHCLCGQTGKTGEIQYCERMSEQHAARFGEETRHGQYCIPIRSNDRVLGIISLAPREGHRPVPEEREFLMAAADTIASIVQRKRAAQELASYVEHVERANASLQEAHLEALKQRHEAQEAKAQLEAAQRELMDASRHAGMAEIAGGVLHSVGNVLNSTNISAQLAADQVRQMSVAGLSKAAELIQNHAVGLGTFLTADPKGRQLPGYLVQLAEHLGRGQAAAVAELESLSKSIDHIKAIVNMQQTYARAGGVVETFPVDHLIADALRMSSESFKRHGIEVVRDGDAEQELTADRQKLLQILVNLIRNAKHSLRDHGPPTGERRLVVRVERPAAGRLRISVTDNGGGIREEDMPRIFTLGFTTKRNGHGFGLHSSALAAKQMGGRLTARSEGPGRGATFVLELPLQPVEVQT